jgi:protein-disulfide isomerase
VLATCLVSSLGAFGAVRVLRRLPDSLRARQLAGTADDLLDLADEVDPARDHIRGGADAAVTLLEYGDFECPYCGQAEVVIRELLSSFGAELRYVWRHLPLNDVHPRAEVASEAAEAAAAQGRYWEMHDRLLADQELLDLGRHAEEIGLDMDRFWDDLHRHRHLPRIAEDVASADASGVAGTPTFFINGRRHFGAYDVETLTAAVKAAQRRAQIRQAAAA